jgi:PiT family inorganic phosphate transporter
MAAVLAAILWKLITGRLGLPSSSSHSLLGGLVGAVVASHGTTVLQSDGLIKVTIALILSPTLGLVFGYLVMNAILFLARGASPRINEFFKQGHLITAVTLALSHGTSNAQKTMGIVALGRVGTGLNQDFAVPLWVVASSAAALAVGTLFGGRRVIRTVGGRFYKVRPVHSFASQNTAAVIILGAALLGGPVSTTQTVSSTIVGVGSAERLSKVRWAVFYEIGLAWILTIPATVLMAALLYFLINGLTLL